MTTKKSPNSVGSSVQDWFDEEEARSPGFIAAIDEANLREETAAALKKLREDNGLTQVELAGRLGVKQPVIARVESGKVMPDLRTVHRIAHALGYLVDAPSFRPMPGLRPEPEAEPKNTLEMEKPMRPDGALAKIVGDEPLPRNEIVKKLWAYVKKRGLQETVDPLVKKKKRRIVAAAALAKRKGSASKRHDA